MNYNPNNITYHGGDLDIPTRRKGESYHRMFNMCEGLKCSNFGYGILGTGIYHTTDAYDIFVNPEAHHPKAYALNISPEKYSCLQANNDKEAERIMSFLTSIQADIMASCIGRQDEDIYNSSQPLNSARIIKLYNNLAVLLSNQYSQNMISFDEFKEFINKEIVLFNTAIAKGVFPEENLKYNPSIPVLNYSKEFFIHKDNIATSLLKKMNIQGVDLRGTSYDNMEQGSTIFNLDNNDIIATFYSEQELEDFFLDNLKKIIELKNVKGL